MYPRRIGAAWEAFAPAKLNLYLDVLGRRTDGFHELETLMAPIRLSDHLVWNPRSDSGDRFSLAYHPSTPSELQAAVPADRRNLVWRAIDALGRSAGVEPHGQITLTKRIPAQAGLGGGSSDAAAALLLANDAWGLGFSRRRLSDIAATLGSDVPFFLAGQSAVCRGRGERVEPVDSMPRLDVVVVTPPQGVSTAVAFGALNAGPVDRSAQDRSNGRLAQLLGALHRGSLQEAGRCMANSLQLASSRLCPWIERLGTAFAGAGCHAHLLTGSGSAYFGVMKSARHARRAASLLASANLGTVFASATCR